MEHDSPLAIQWFENNHNETKSRKVSSLSFRYKHENIWARIGETKIWESRKQKLLGVEIIIIHIKVWKVSLEWRILQHSYVENKIFDFQFGPVCANQTRQITVLEASKMK